MVNSSLVNDPTVWQAGLDLPQYHWTQINCLQTKKDLETTDKKRTVFSQIVISCLQTKLDGGLHQLYLADNVAIQ